MSEPLGLGVEEPVVGCRLGVAARGEVVEVPCCGEQIKPGAGADALRGKERT
jgi:hypothetical protein